MDSVYIFIYIGGFGRGLESIDIFIPIPIVVRIWHFTVYRYTAEAPVIALLRPVYTV